MENENLLLTDFFDCIFKHKTHTIYYYNIESEISELEVFYNLETIRFLFNQKDSKSIYLDSLDESFFTLNIGWHSMRNVHECVLILYARLLKEEGIRIEPVWSANFFVKDNFQEKWLSTPIKPMGLKPKSIHRSKNISFKEVYSYFQKAIIETREKNAKQKNTNRKRILK